MDSKACQAPTITKLITNNPTGTRHPIPRTRRISCHNGNAGWRVMPGILIAQAPQIFERADPEQRRELVGLLTSNRVLKGRTLEFELRKPFDALVTAANSENGWAVRIRTREISCSKGRRGSGP